MDHCSPCRVGMRRGGPLPLVVQKPRTNGRKECFSPEWTCTEGSGCVVHPMSIAVGKWGWGKCWWGIVVAFFMCFHLIWRLDWGASQGSSPQPAHVASPLEQVKNNK